MLALATASASGGAEVYWYSAVPSMHLMLLEVAEAEVARTGLNLCGAPYSLPAMPDTSDLLPGVSNAMPSLFHAPK